MQTLPNMYNVYELGYLQTLFEKNEHNIYIYIWYHVVMAYL